MEKAILCAHIHWALFMHVLHLSYFLIFPLYSTASISEQHAPWDHTTLYTPLPLHQLAPPTTMDMAPTNLWCGSLFYCNKVVCCHMQLVVHVAHSNKYTIVVSTYCMPVHASHVLSNLMCFQVDYQEGSQIHPDSVPLWCMYLIIDVDGEWGLVCCDLIRKDLILLCQDAGSDNNSSKPSSRHNTVIVSAALQSGWNPSL